MEGLIAFGGCIPTIMGIMPVAKFDPLLLGELHAVLCVLSFTAALHTVLFQNVLCKTALLAQYWLGMGQVASAPIRGLFAIGACHLAAWPLQHMLACWLLLV